MYFTEFRAVVATLVAFRSILIAPFGLVDPAEFEYWFFIPDRDSGAISLLVACWFLWNRRTRLAAQGMERIDWAHWAGAAAVLFLFSWAVWTRTQALLIPALCALLAMLAASVTPTSKGPMSRFPSAKPAMSRVFIIPRMASTTVTKT